jgi:pyruvate ferredoxin oxidoreductase delta subunit
MAAKPKTKAKDLNIGATITTPGNSAENKTGGWRALRPVWNKEKCTQCMICWMFCPDMAIPQKNGKRIETNLDFCKGCGICKSECSFGAITMEKEKK